MKEYLKMHECFDIPLTTSKLESGMFSIIQNSGLSICAEFSCDAEAEAIEHAINSHDELVAEVERLRGEIDILNCRLEKHMERMIDSMHK